MKKQILLSLLLILMHACTGSPNKKLSAKELVIVGQDAVMQDDSPTRRVYANEGLKYVTIITLDVKENGEVSGKVSSIDYNFLDDDNEENHHKAFFKGKIRKNTISVEFDGDPPMVGDNSDWTDKEWRIEVIDDVETIVIPFNAKDYTTSEWELTDYEFPLSDEYNEVGTNLHKNYSDFPVAYVKEGALYFFDPESQTGKRFTEEPDSVFNCVYSYHDDKFYYTVSKNGMLSLKEVDLSGVPAQISLLKALGKPTEQFLTESFNEKSTLNFFNNNLLLEYDFDWEYYGFVKHIEYSIGKKTTTLLNSDQYADKYSEWIEGGGEPTKDYAPIYEKAKQFDFSEYPEGNMDEPDYYFGGETADESKIVFGIALAVFDYIHGPYCVANADGSMMKLLDDTSMASKFNPVWSNNNVVYIREREIRKDEPIKELCYTIAATNEPVVIDTNVDYYAVKK